MRILLFITLFFSSCSHSLKPTRPVKTQGPLYPAGKYEHHVHVKLRRGETLRMRGLFSFDSHKILIVGLSPTQTTLFKVRQNKGEKQPQLEIFWTPMKRFEKELKEQFNDIVKLFKLRYQDLNPQAHVSLTAMNGHTIDITFSDHQDFFQSIQVKHPSYTIKIRVRPYADD